jgi:hypothetical protein
MEFVSRNEHLIQLEDGDCGMQSYGVSCTKKKGSLMDSLDLPILATNMPQDYTVHYSMLYDSY